MRAFSPRNASLSLLSVATCFAAALALLFDLENNFGSSKAAAKQVATEGSDSDELRER